MARNGLARLEDKEKAVSLYKTGSTYNQISQILNVNKSTISYWCRDLAAKRLAEKKEATLRRKNEEKANRKPKNKAEEIKYAQPPYSGWHIRSTNSSDGCERITLYNPVIKQTRFMSKARYIMSVHLGRVLENYERVYHKNGTENVIENLFVSTTTEKEARTRAEKTLPCANPDCGKNFFRRYEGRKYCSARCFHSVRTANRKIRIHKPRMAAAKNQPVQHIKECAWCEKTFTTTRSNVEICSKKCREAMRRYANQHFPKE